MYCTLSFPTFVTHVADGDESIFCLTDIKRLPRILSEAWRQSELLWSWKSSDIVPNLNQPKPICDRWQGRGNESPPFKFFILR